MSNVIINLGPTTTSYICSDCGMELETASEWHPWLFCLLWKNGVDDPERHLADLGYERVPT